LARIAGVVLALVVVLAVISSAAQGAIQPPPPYAPEPAPDIEAAYADAQADPQLDEKDKIASAVDTYVRLHYESLVRGKGLDLGMVIDRSKPSGEELYNYELGLLQYCLLCWRETGVGVVSYDYTLQWDSLEMEHDSARAKVVVIGHQVFRQEPTAYPFEQAHDFTLVKETSGWMIIGDDYQGEASRTYPRGTDFAALAASFESRLKAWQAVNEPTPNEPSSGRSSDGVKAAPTPTSPPRRPPVSYLLAAAGTTALMVAGCFLVSRWRRARNLGAATNRPPRNGNPR